MRLRERFRRAIFEGKGSRGVCLPCPWRGDQGSEDSAGAAGDGLPGMRHALCPRDVPGYLSGLRRSARCRPDGADVCEHPVRRHRLSPAAVDRAGHRSCRARPVAPDAAGGRCQADAARPSSYAQASPCRAFDAGKRRISMTRRDDS